VSNKAPTLRFVILHHEGIDQPHFDLMFETAPASALATWRSPRWPIDGPTQLIRLGEHRREYLEYEGPLTGERGSVRRVTTGLCEIEIAPDGQFCTIKLGDHSALLNLRQITATEWLAIPSCGG